MRSFCALDHFAMWFHFRALKHETVLLKIWLGFGTLKQINGNQVSQVSPAKVVFFEVLSTLYVDHPFTRPSTDGLSQGG